MFITFRKGKYEIEFSRSINGEQYTIFVLGDNESIKVEAMKLAVGEYKLTIKRARFNGMVHRIHSIECYGGKFRKNYEVMKQLIDEILFKYYKKR